MKICAIILGVFFLKHHPSVEEIEARIHRAFTDEASTQDYFEANRLFPEFEKEVRRLKARHEEARLRQLLRWLPDHPDGRLQLQLLEVRKRIEE